ncbi:NUDIX domain-containing protein [Plantactinospora sp. WMMB334]|uniref:NUDIX domain-containing protein n=1 Tax=Plantactinospora sp. WMMB334 TaxID=3404119 RepID=UPI003B92DC72
MTPRGYGPGAAFCPRCAAPLPGPPPTACTGCRYQLFVNARPTVGLVILDGDPVASGGSAAGGGSAASGGSGLSGQSGAGDGSGSGGPRFLVLRRAAEPMIGRWETPGGFCDGWEHPAEAAMREAREELGVTVTLGDQLGMYIGSYEFQDEVLPVLDTFFLASLDDRRIVLDPAESTELGWFSLVDPPPLAFPTMDEAVRAAARRLGR